VHVGEAGDEKAPGGGHEAGAGWHADLARGADPYDPLAVDQDGLVCSHEIRAGCHDRDVDERRHGRLARSTGLGWVAARREERAEGDHRGLHAAIMPYLSSCVVRGRCRGRAAELGSVHRTRSRLGVTHSATSLPETEKG